MAASTMTAPVLRVHSESVNPPDPEVHERPRRRRFTADYKLAVLAEIDAAPSGTIGAILRRESLYSSPLSAFRAQREAGELAGAPRRRGPKPNPLAAEVAKLRRENEGLRRDLDNARLVIDVQKKVSSLLGISVQTDETP